MLPRHRTLAPTTTSGPGLEHLLRLVATHPFYIAENDSPNTFLPSFINIAATIDTMNAQMITTRKFTETTPQWHPLVSHLYFALCFYVRIFECMKEAQQLSSDQLAAYLAITTTLNTSDMLIPGPLIPHFEALSVSATAPEHLENVSPALPETPGQTGANGLTFPEPARYHLPNIFALLDQLRYFSTTPTATTNADIYRSGHAANLYSVDATDNNDRFLHTFCGPTFRSEIFIPDQISTQFANFARALNLPPRIAAADIPEDSTFESTWLHSLGLTFHQANARNGWIRQVSAAMQRYCSHFRNTVPMSAIPIIGSGAAQVECAYSGTTAHQLTTAPTFHAAADPLVAYYSRSFVTGFHAISRTRNPFVPTAHYHTGLLTRINAHIPDTANHRTGPAWTLAPFYLQTHEADYSLNIDSVISSVYHSTTPLTR
jgi:hypothetical protein